jgi:hypothetical protein
VNFAAAPQVIQGWPLLIRVHVIAPEGGTFDFSPAEVALKVTDAAGNDVNWALKPAVTDPSRPTTRPVGARLTADDQQIGVVVFVLADTSAVATGAYQITPSLAGAESQPERIQIIAAPAKLNEKQEAHRFFLEAKSAIATGDPDRAIALADDRLKVVRRDMLSWRLKGDALAAKGDRRGSTAAYLQALNLFYLQNPRATEPPDGLMDALKQVQAAGGG